MATASHILMST